MHAIPPSHCEACGTALEGRHACLCCGLLVAPVASPKKSPPAAKSLPPRVPAAKVPAKVSPVARPPLTPVPPEIPAAPPRGDYAVECLNCGTDWGPADLSCPACLHGGSQPMAPRAGRPAAKPPPIPGHPPAKGPMRSAVTRWLATLPALPPEVGKIPLVGKALASLSTEDLWMYCIVLLAIAMGAFLAMILT